MKRLLIALAAIVVLTLGLVAPAAAQGQTVTADPATVDAAGMHEITVTGTGYTGALFLLPCPGAGGDVTAVAEDSCDLGSLTPVTPEADGTWTATATFDIPEEGLVLVGGNADQSEVAAVAVSVGPAEAMDDAAPEAETTAETADEALAETGVETYMMIVVGMAMLGAGVMMARAGRYGTV